MNIRELRDAISVILPDASLEEDLDGQLVLYTNIMLDDEGNLIPFEPEDDYDPDIINRLRNSISWMTDDDLHDIGE